MSDREDRSPGYALGPIEVPRAADVLADRLRAQILSGALSAGHVLPAERALVQETGLGRASVREALHVLEVEALVSPRLGRYGGWVVRQPGEDSITRSVDVFIRGRQIRFEALLAAREAIEPSCAALAADNRTAEDIARIDQHTQTMRECWRDLPSYLLENVRWHLAVVKATHNELLIAFMTALGEAIHAGTNIDDFNSEDVRRAALHAHDSVNQAIRAGDRDAAFRRMYRHVHAFREQATDVPTAPRLTV